ncbi:uncharacterized protein A4U43_C08F35600 [Asparagus officinalis]|nr:uncharacterized protein A4U43_C08F35600 [Asparagus officinalis]
MDARRCRCSGGAVERQLARCELAPKCDNVGYTAYVASCRRTDKSSQLRRLTVACWAGGACRCLSSDTRRQLAEAVRDIGAGGDGDGEERGRRVPDSGQRRVVGRGDQRGGVRRRQDVPAELSAGVG